MYKPIIITGAAGFIGFHLSLKLIKSGINVLGIDNINDYYDTHLKEKRLEILSNLSKKNNWKFIKTDLVNKETILEIFNEYNPETVVNLAAQAGVRYSLKNPSVYIYSNIVGFSNILEACKTSKVKNLFYASSSSVYGGNTKVPFSEDDSVDHPVSIYAATKRSNELMAHSYSHLYGIACTGLRFFTVYGPWGRPDMAPMLFTNCIIKNKPIKIFNYGKMSRSFTFIDDVIEVVFRLLKKPALPDKDFNKNKPNISSSWCPHKIVNIGNSNATKIEEFISELEKALGIKAIKEYQKMQPGDIKDTLADDKIIRNLVGDYAETNLQDGINKFVKWYRDYYCS